MDGIKDEVLETPELDPGEKVYTYRERALRDLFIKEYLVDYDEISAAIRIGYGKSYAREYAIKFMHEAYVQKEIKAQEIGGKADDPEEMKKRIMAGLVREANYRGPGCSQAARVAALAKLASLNGMDKPVQTENAFLDANGQPLLAGAFVIPGLMTPEQWETAAQKQQEALVDSTTTKVPVAPNVNEGVVIR
jgi:hypothetical protein